MSNWWIWLLLVGGSALLAIIAAILVVTGQNPHGGTHALLVYGP